MSQEKPERRINDFFENTNKLSEGARKLLSLIPDEGFIGNNRLRREFYRIGYPLEKFWLCRQELLNNAYIRKGKGKGGSVARTAYLESIGALGLEKEGDYETAKIEVNLPEFVNSVNLEEVTRLSSSRLKDPEMAHIDEILNFCADTSWVLPRFQRYFDWKKDDIASFLKSIFSDYYVGAFLLWQAGGEPQVSVDQIKGVERGGKLKSDLIILDGQQRITSLYYAVCAPNLTQFHDKDRWRETRIFREHPIYFYIDFNTYLRSPTSPYVIKVRNKRLTEEECFKSIWFPLCELQQHAEWLAKFRKFLEGHSDNHDKIYDLVDALRKKLYHMLAEFEIPYICLPKGMRLEQVTEIFEQLNTKGKMLSVFDLLVARLYKYNISLKELWDESTKKYPNIFRYSKSIDKTPIYILQAISLFYDAASSTARADLLNIYERIYEFHPELKFCEHWQEFSEYINFAIEKLENLRKDGFGVKDQKEVPFTPMIPVIAALLKLTKDQKNEADCHEKLKRWYWASVFSNAYSEAADTQMTADFREMREWFKDENKPPKIIVNIESVVPNLRLIEVQSQSNAKYRGVMSIIALEGAQDFDSGLTLENARSNDKHHMFPRSGDFASSKGINSVLNMTWLSKESNIEIKKYQKPSEYAKYFISKTYHGDQSKFEEILRTHLVHEEAYCHLLKDQFEMFLLEREKTITLKIEKYLGIEVDKERSTIIEPDDPFGNKMLYRDMVRSCDEFIYYVDKYFTVDGLEFLAQYVDPSKTKDIKIIMAIDYADEEFRDLFKDFKQSMTHKGVTCNLRVMPAQLRKDFHDRWILSKNRKFSIPSPQIIKRGQWSAITELKDSPPFLEFWEMSMDIISDWDRIKNYREDWEKRQQSGNP